MEKNKNSILEKMPTNSQFNNSKISNQKKLAGEMPMKKSNKRPKTNFELKPYFMKYKWYFIFYAFMALCVYSVLAILEVMATAGAIEQVTLGIKYDDREYYTKAIYYALFACGMGVIGFTDIFMTLMIKRISNRICYDLSLDVYRHVFKIDSESYSNYGSGVIWQRIENDAQSIVNYIASIISAIYYALIEIAIFSYILYLNIYIGLVLVLILAITFAIEKYRLKIRARDNKEMLKNSDNIFSISNEVIKSEKDIKSLGLGDSLYDSLKKSHNKYLSSRIQYSLDDNGIRFWRNLVMNVSIIGLFILGVVFIEKSIITMATFMVLYTNRYKPMSLINRISYISSNIVDIKVRAVRFKSLFDEKNFVTEKFGDVELKDISGRIEFRDVEYAYKEYENIDFTKEEYKKYKKEHKNIDMAVQRKVVSTTKVFDKLNFVIEPNTTVAFVGKSGSGKSTILDLMSKMRVVDRGEVLIDSVNINDLSKESLRQNISLINQFPYIFDKSIKENLLLANPNATMEEIDRAIVDASFDEFVGELKNGIDTRVGENGVKLSGGQKQRLAIARALLRKSKILILDESTSSLDNFAQENIKSTIDNLKGKSTIIIVAHRLSTIKNVDKIFFLENGKIVDSGTFKELNKKNPTFNAMFKMENL